MSTPKEAQEAHYKLADYLLEWLETRNRAELAETLGNMTVSDRRVMREELALILANGGKPPNWVGRS